MEPLRPQRLQILVFALLFFAGFLAIGMRFWQLQIETHANWKKEAANLIAKQEKYWQERARERERREKARAEAQQ